MSDTRTGVAKIRSILEDSLNEAVAYQGHRQRADAEEANETLDRMVARIAELEQHLVTSARVAAENQRLRAELAAANQHIEAHLEWLKRDSQYAENQKLRDELAAANLRAGQAEWTRNLAQAASTRDVEAKQLVERERDAARKHLVAAVNALRIFAENQPVMEAIDCAFATVTRSSVDKAAAVVARFDALGWTA